MTAYNIGMPHEEDDEGIFFNVYPIKYVMRETSVLGLGYVYAILHSGDEVLLKKTDLLSSSEQKNTCNRCIY